MIKIQKITAQNFLSVSNSLNECLDTLNSCFCSRCGFGPVPSMFGHHTGKITQYLSHGNSNFTNKWVEDVEHGLFHGLCTAILATYFLGEKNTVRDLINYYDAKYLPAPGKLRNTDLPIYSKKSLPVFVSKRFKKNIECEKLFASCILHDYFKVASGVHENHDSLLKTIFPNLINETYFHSEAKNHNDPFLLSDVCELRRYSDYKIWMDNRIDKNLTKKDNFFLDLFYNIIRPAFLVIFENRYHVWVGHGPESSYKITSEQKYPIGKDHPDMEGWSIEHDRLPFSLCGSHEGGNKNFSLLRGWMPFKEADKHHVFHNNKNPRDHLTINCNTNLKDWMFVANNFSEISNRTWLFNIFENLLDSNQKVILNSTLLKFWRLMIFVEDRMKLLSDSSDEEIAKIKI